MCVRPASDPCRVVHCSTVIIEEQPVLSGPWGMKFGEASQQDKALVLKSFLALPQVKCQLPSRPRLAITGRKPSFASLGFTHYSQVDILGVQYKVVNFGAEKRPG